MPEHTACGETLVLCSNDRSFGSTVLVVNLKLCHIRYDF